MSSFQQQELRSQLRIALPIFGGQLAQSANGFVDTVMAGRVSALDLAAVAVGASIWVPVFLFLTGLLMSTTSVLGLSNCVAMPENVRAALAMATAK